MTVPYRSLTPVQAAVYVRLTSDTLLMSMVEGVFDSVPEGTPYPYVKFGSWIETPDNAHGRFGRRALMTLDVWSAYDGYGEVNTIMGRLDELLDQQPLSIVGCRHVSTAFEFAQSLEDPDRPQLRHGSVRYRITTSKE